MDIKRLLISIVIAVVALVIFNKFMANVNPQPAASQPGTTTQSTTGPAAQNREYTLVTGVSNDPVLLGSDVKSDTNPLRLQLSVSPRGGGLNAVVLNQYDATVQHKSRYVYQTPIAEFEDQSRALTFRQLTLDDRLDDKEGPQDLQLASRNWAAVSTDKSVKLLLGLKDKQTGEQVLSFEREYVIQPASDPGQGYEVLLTQKIQNTSNRPVSIGFGMSGPTPPPREIDNHDDRQILGGFERAGRITAQAHLLSEFTGDKSVINLTKYKDDYVFKWVGTSSAYFAALLLPSDPSQFAGIDGVKLADGSPVEKVAIRLTGKTETLQPQQTQTVSMKLFFGPKKRDVVQSAYYSQSPMQYATTLKTYGGGCTFCTFDFMIDGLVWLLSMFHLAVRDWGLAIILLVVLVRLILHPITKKSTISMHKMGKMGPEIERLKKKYGDDKETLNREMMALYKEQGTTPILGCLPMFLQMPIWIALWSCLQNTFELRQMPFLYGLTWIKDLAQADRLIYFPNSPVNLWFIHFDSINLLPILMGVVYYIQQKIQPKPAAMNEQQAQQQKMMGLMVLIFPLFLYKLPSGLNLYMVTSSTLGIIETKRIRAHIKQQEEAETQGKVFVDAGPTRASKQMAKLKQKGTVTEAAKGGLAGWVARMQQRAEDLRKEADRRKKDDDRRK